MTSQKPGGLEFISFCIQRHPWFSEYSLYLSFHSNGKTFRAKPLIIEEAQEGGPLDPTLQISKESLTRLMTEMWDAGIRPNVQHGSADQVDAIKYHLEDMRRLVFDSRKDGKS